ncbi:RnfABCDGE type electron transport complex subunit D [Proteiniclasticum ruminis]|uniref:Electron transport complex protein RnfD n=1 Tax=Proteiniclasticum ruminis TaxID=398199 RepID=A0A1G8QTN6_9CLOT|nr:RnfABCDGE type electron transport complex subunit D [Proteiniclasticum ruminis]SDJ08058.1 electron transport complex protein RnfD [Proteiniclasticum ruminis]
MKFLTKVSPNNRDKDHSTQSVMAELTVGLLVVFIFSMVFYFQEYGMDYVIHGVLLMVTAIVVSLLTEAVFALATKKNILKHVKSSFPLVTAIILVLTVPISTTYFAIGVASFFAIFVGKLIFGGFGHNIFNPAGVGRAVIFASLMGSTVADVTTSATPISSIANAGWLIKDAAVTEKFLEQFGGLSNLLLGWYPGAIGETSALLILLVGAYLAYRKVLDWKVPAVYIGSVFVFTTIIALVNGVGMWYPMFHVLAGGLVFGAVFMATDPVTNPTTISGRIIYAIGLAALTVIIRLQASLPGGVVFAILIMNMVSPLIDKLTDGWSIYSVKKYSVSIAVTFAAGILLTFMAGNGLEPKAIEFPREGGGLGIFTDSQDNLPEVLEQTEEGSVVTFVLSAPGYYAIQSGGEPNKIEVKINKDTNIVESVAIVSVNDTPGLGDRIDDASFLDQFKGISFEDKNAGVDAVSGATISSTSVTKAVRIAFETLNK